MNDDATDRGQAIQINDNTVDDPGRDADLPMSDDDLHSRRDVVKTDQGIQINDNTIDDQK